MIDVLVIGGGLAGAASAAHLARAGREVVLLERERGPHDKVCGEFLSLEAQDYLRQLDIDPAALGAATIDAVAIQRGQARAETNLPFRAQSLSRRILDETVLSRATVAGARIRRGTRATSLERMPQGWRVGLDTAGSLLARHVFLATGKHDLRGWRRPQGGQPDLIGFKSYWRLVEPAALGGTVELHLFPGGYAGLEMVEGDRANLCLVVRRQTFAALGRRWEGLLAHLLAACPGLARHLRGATACESRPLAIAAIPYGLLQKESEGLWRVGDQAAVIPSFTGEGMSIALHSARLAADFLLADKGPDPFQRRLARDLGAQLRRSTLASRALVTPLGQAAVGFLLSPPVMRWALHGTRIPLAVRLGPDRIPA